MADTQTDALGSLVPPEVSAAAEPKAPELPKVTVPVLPEINMSSVPRKTIPFKTPEGFLDYTDFPKVREYFLTKVLQAASEIQPVSNERFQLSIKDVEYDKKDPTIRDEESAILEGRSLVKKLTGRYELKDLTTGKTYTTRRRTLMNVPWMTSGGFYVINGVPYSMNRQFRLDPGVYARITADGKAEAQFNIAQGTGVPFRVQLDPTSGVFQVRIAGYNLPLYQVLKTMGIPDDDMRKAWGPELYEVNKNKKPHSSVTSWLNKTIEAEKTRIAAATNKKSADITADEALRTYFARMRLDKGVTQRLMGIPYEVVTPESILHASLRILNISRGVEETDSRDNPSNQSLYDEGDHFATYLKLDRGGVLRTALWKLKNDPERLSKLPPGLLDQHVSHHFNNTGLVQVLEQINPLEALVQAHKVTRLGEGAIEDLEAAPDEARNVQPGYMGFIDPLKGPESLRIGLDVYLARSAVKGPDNKIYARFRDTKTGKIVWLNPVQLENEFIGNPGVAESKERFLPALSPKYGAQYLTKDKIKYELVDDDDLFTLSSDTIPLKSGVKGMRQLMGSKFVVHALPLENPEVPLVQTYARDGSPVSLFLSKYAGAVHSPISGTVVKVTDGGAVIRDPQGEEQKVEWYRWIPYARKTYLQHKPGVKAGDKVKEGDILAYSNYTDPKGRFAIGKNLRVAFMPYRGYNFEDAVVISESAKDKLTSVHVYTQEVENKENKEIDKVRFTSLFPALYTSEQLANVGDDGVIKKGAEVRKGDPLVLAVESRMPDQATLGRRLDMDRSEVWDQSTPGIVKEVIRTKDGIRIFIETKHPLQVGDKLAGPHGNKGVVSLIVPDEEMPRDAEGKPFEVLISPKGIPSRTNPALVLSAQLGKIAAKTGKPYVLPGFMKENMVDFVETELQKHGISDTEDIFDPVSGKTVPRVGTGVLYLYKTQQEAEAKGHARETGGYSSDEEPSRGVGEAAKHFGDMEYGALLASGATEVLSDLKTIQGQANPEFWRQVKLGGTPSLPKTPVIYDKFRALIRASGVKLEENTPKGDQIFAATDKDIRELTGDRKITKGETLDTRMRPIPGGLFSPQETGYGGAGDRFAYIALPEPMLNPLMESMARYLLDMKAAELEDVMVGRRPVNGKVGGEALKQLLSQIDLNRVVKEAKEVLNTGDSPSKRDAAAKKLIFAQALLDRKLSPADFMMTRVPVLPPKFRKIVAQEDRLVVPDLNYLYKRLIAACDDFNEAKQLGSEALLDARDHVLHAYRALVGVEPPRDKDLQVKRVGGILQQLLGKGSPKASFTQRKVLGFNVDLSALGVIVPNPKLKLDEVGIPEEYAWNVYGPFVIREMVQSGRGATEAARALKERSEPAKAALIKAMSERPVILNRAPTLHRYGIMAFKPIPVPGNAIQINPQICGPYGADFDGDAHLADVAVLIEKQKWGFFNKKHSASFLGKPLYWWKYRHIYDTEIDGGVYGVFAINLADFPHSKSRLAKKGHISIYKVPDDIKILVYDEAKKKLSPAYAAFWSRHENRKLTIINTEQKYHILTDKNPRAIFGLDTRNYEFVRCSPTASSFVCIPVSAELAGYKKITMGCKQDKYLGYFLGVLGGVDLTIEKSENATVIKTARLSKSVEAKLSRVQKYYAIKIIKGKDLQIEIADRALADLCHSCFYLSETAKNKTKIKRDLLPAIFSLSALGSVGVLEGLLSVVSKFQSCKVTDCITMSIYARASADMDSMINIKRLLNLLGMGSHFVRCEDEQDATPALCLGSTAVHIEKCNMHGCCKVKDIALDIIELGIEQTDRKDLVPLSHGLCKEIVKKLSKYGMKYKWLLTKLNCCLIPRTVAAALLNKLPADFAHPHLQMFRSLVENKNVTWDRVESVQQTSYTTTLYDLTVPGFETFTTLDGLVLSNTMSFTVPVSKAAINEAYAKMLPSRNLLSRHSGQPHYIPTQETHEGLYIMTKHPRNKPVKVFNTVAEVKDALQRGELEVDDPIQVREV